MCFPHLFIYLSHFFLTAQREMPLNAKCYIGFWSLSNVVPSVLSWTVWNSGHLHLFSCDLMLTYFRFDGRWKKSRMQKGMNKTRKKAQFKVSVRKVVFCAPLSYKPWTELLYTTICSLASSRLVRWLLRKALPIQQYYL